MKQPATVQDDLKEMVFPSGGLNLVQPSFIVRAETSELAENVRFFESLTKRGRGGSRPGISKFIDEQVSGNHAIQHLAAIVTVDEELIGYSFDGVDQEFPGIYGGIGFINFDLQLLPPFFFPTIPAADAFGNESFVGGSGYPPKAAAKKTTLTIEPSATSAEINTNVQITLTLLDGDGNPFLLPNKVVTLYTDPPGEVGDGFATTIVGGSTQVDVSAWEPKTVTYRAKAVAANGAVVAISNKVKVRFISSNPALIVTHVVPNF